MKKIFILASVLVAGMSLSAQETDSQQLVGRKGTPILPKAGDYAIGVEATPYLNYLGNIFNNTEDNSLELGSQTLHGRYFIDDNTAIRLSLTIQADSYTNRYYVRDDAAYYQDNLSNDKTVDAQKSIQNEVGLGIGLQKFRGYGRLRGTYGAIAYFSYEKDKYEYTYGNPITSINQIPTSHWGSQAERSLEYNYGAYKTVGVAALAGVEYYFAPKICIGGEIGLGYSYGWSGQSNNLTEKWNGSKVIEQTNIDSPGDRYSSLSTFRPATFGNLYLMFHF